MAEEEMRPAAPALDPGRGRSTVLLTLPVAAGGVMAVLLAAWGELGLLACVLGQTALSAAALAAPRSPERGIAPRRAAPAGDRQDLLAASPDPVVAVDARLVVTGANEAARAIVPGLRLHQPLSFALRAPEVLDAVRQSFASGEPGSVEFGGLAATDPTYDVRLRPLRAEDGTVSSVALFFRDLTGERRLEQMRVDFIATVSHELRTPLASLAGFIDTLKGPARNDTAARERFLDIMRAQADRMARLVDDLLQLSRVELRAHLAPSSPVELGPIVGHMIEIMAPLARERGVVISQAFDPGPLLVPGDRDELLRVVENLVENAVKYGGGGGRVEVALARTADGRSIDLLVRDHGPGIAPEHLPRLTERFYRVDVADSRAQGGTGLGLAIVKHIVLRHRGRLTIESEPGEGASVRVRLPAAAEQGER